MSWHSLQVAGAFQCGAGGGRRRQPFLSINEPLERAIFHVLFNNNGLMVVKILQEKRIRTVSYVTNTALPKVVSSTCEVRSTVSTRTTLDQHKNTSDCSSKVTMPDLNELGISTLIHFPYSPDLTPWCIWLSPKLKKSVKEILFSSLQDLEMSKGVLFNFWIQADKVKILYRQSKNMLLNVVKV